MDLIKQGEPRGNEEGLAEVVRSTGAEYFETSAMTGENVVEVFEKIARDFLAAGHLDEASEKLTKVNKGKESTETFFSRIFKRSASKQEVDFYFIRIPHSSLTLCSQSTSPGIKAPLGPANAAPRSNEASKTETTSQVGQASAGHNESKKNEVKGDVASEFELLGAIPTENFLLIETCQKYYNTCMKIVFFFRDRQKKQEALSWFRAAKLFQKAKRALEAGEVAGIFHKLSLLFIHCSFITTQIHFVST